MADPEPGRYRLAKIGGCLLALNGAALILFAAVLFVSLDYSGIPAITAVLTIAGLSAICVAAAVLFRPNSRVRMTLAILISPAVALFFIWSFTPTTPSLLVAIVLCVPTLCLIAASVTMRS